MRFEGKGLSFGLVGNTLEVELHKEPCNEIGTTMLAELEKVADCIAHGALGASAVIVYSSVRRGFCAGADLNELQAGMAEQRQGGAGASLLKRLPRGKRVVRAVVRRVAEPVIRRRVGEFIDRIHRTFDTIDMAPIPVVVATHGVTFGGGFELALLGDLIIADKSTRFCFPELRLGIIPGFGGIPRLERDCGNAVVRDLLLTGRSVNASRAHEVGLIHQVVPRGEALNAARRTVEQLVKYDGATVATAKRFLKPLPAARLAEEKRVFVDMVVSGATRDALDRFVSSDDVRPYLA